MGTQQLSRSQGRGGEALAKEREERSHPRKMGDRHVPSRVLSNGPDIRPDLNISPNEHVTKEDFHKWMKANDTVLRARARQSFIAGAICGIFVLVSIIMAGVSLGKIAENAGNLADHEGKKVKMEDLEDGLKSMLDDLESNLAKKLDSSALQTKLTALQITKADFESYVKGCTVNIIDSKLECD